jgi:nitroimidazol reductase NimA-like FMN-containing flavoprotein (pyridoxamine 5'-phosphate oxidase superfamily)
MLIQDMTRDASLSLLKSSTFGRIACTQGAQSYITPFSFAYFDDVLYGFGTVGLRIDSMRNNPLVCVEIDAIVSREEWRTLVILGRYRELTDTEAFAEERATAHALLSQVPDWWNPGYTETIAAGRMPGREPIYYGIAIDTMTGRQGTP